LPHADELEIVDSIVLPNRAGKKFTNGILQPLLKRREILHFGFARFIRGRAQSQLAVY
jgi:hypothetical protein